MARILFVYSNPARFVRIDRDLLAEDHEVHDWRQPGRWANPLAVLAAVWRNDLVFGWFASWHTFWPITLAWLTRRPSILVVGGFDTANRPDLGYGYQQGGARRHLSRWIMARAGTLITNSHASRREITDHVGIPAERVTVLHHGVPDPFDSPGKDDRAPIALTVGFVAEQTLRRKGLEDFVRAAAALPEVRFVLAGPWRDGAVERLRAVATPNVELTGWLSDAELAQLLRTASVYVQASRHEGFGLSLAEAMLAGCIPVVTRAGALGEVVGDAAVTVTGDGPAAVADGVRRALELGPQARARARARVVESFPLDLRRRGLRAAARAALAG